MRKLIIILFLTGIIITGCSNHVQVRSWNLCSPDSAIKISLSLQNGRLFYNVDYNLNKRWLTALEQSPLGISRKDQDFINNLKFLTEKPVRKIDEAYSMLTGKKHACRNYCNETELLFENPDHAKISLVLRAYPDGAAFRYCFPEKSKVIHTVTGEATGFKIPGGRAWMMPYDKRALWAPAYENNYQNAIAVGTKSSSEVGWALPALFNSDGLWILLAEADIDTTFYGFHLEPVCDSGLYRVRMPEPDEAEGVGKPQPENILPWKTPWRVILVGPTPATIIETTIIHNLSEPSAFSDFSWIKPGRSSWSWWSDHNSPRDYNKLKPYVDLSSEMGWEYSLVDANWNEMKNGNIIQLIEYAKTRKVGLTLWYNSGGPHNKITEQPRDIMNDPVKRREEFKKLEQWGVKGVKVDFFQSDNQTIMSLYQRILKDAADYHMLVVFHGCTCPRGWARTWPNLMSMEGVRGAEQYWDSTYAEQAQTLNSILPFTRNTVGSMDFTPVTFTDSQVKHKTTNAHELALSVIFESGIIHLADRASAYRAAPDYVKGFLKVVPSAWDDTRYVCGEPGSYLVLARMKGNTWYLGGVNGEKLPKEIEFALPFLEKENYKVDLVMDGKTDRAFANSSLNYHPGEKIKISMLARGGFVATVRHSSN